jgi:ornithine cyclodeaminase/alanine dehydrogenase-like protein (mu-crystallin family)
VNTGGTHGAKAAFEITKGRQQLVTLSEADVERCLDLRELLDGLEDGFRSLESGEIHTPARTEVTVAGKGFSLTMPAWRPGMAIAVKVVNVFEANLELGLPTHLAIVGYHPPAGELPVVLARSARLYVESLDAFMPTPVGCSELAGIEVKRGTTLGAVALRRAPGRVSDGEITVYKAMGIAMEEMVAANLTYRRAKHDHVGGTMAW